jgi:hypothetical protein
LLPLIGFWAGWQMGAALSRSPGSSSGGGHYPPNPPPPGLAHVFTNLLAAIMAVALCFFVPIPDFWLALAYTFVTACVGYNIRNQYWRWNDEWDDPYADNPFWDPPTILMTWLCGIAGASGVIWTIYEFITWG